ncbi:MAG: DNA-formamidopyrimidine glycosylase, partial [Gemmatimonadota bacterium]|nr:DNA-formamidopyrimidine glycosylase [Gemmatimonadota bacterium]
FTLDDGRRLVLEDSRALATLDVHPADAPLDLGLGPEPTDPSLTADGLRRTLERRRGAIKPVLLDQRVIAGIGNIYAAEALWRAKISPRVRAASLSEARLQRLLDSIRAVIARATGARYTEIGAARLNVYDREGRSCRRCGTPIRRIVQAGRSTFYCPSCQR